MKTTSHTLTPPELPIEVLNAYPAFPAAVLPSEKPLLLLPWLACRIGINEAIVLQQIHFLCSLKTGGKTIRGHKWIWNTYEAWKADHFPFWSIRTVRTTIESLENQGLIHSCQPDGHMSRKKYYRVNPDRIAVLNRELAKSGNP